MARRAALRRRRRLCGRFRWRRQRSGSRRRGACWKPRRPGRRSQSDQPQSATPARFLSPLPPPTASPVAAAAAAAVPAARGFTTWSRRRPTTFAGSPPACRQRLHLHRLFTTAFAASTFWCRRRRRRQGGRRQRAMSAPLDSVRSAEYMGSWACVLGLSSLLKLTMRPGAVFSI